MSITEIINEFEISKCKGLQVIKLKGIISSTWLFYKRNDFYYYFDINQKIEFVDRYKYTSEELVSEFKNSFFLIDEIII